MIVEPEQNYTYNEQYRQVQVQVQYQRQRHRLAYCAIQLTPRDLGHLLS
jgi:hypothetical protein